jgi:SAM-dependent methyltransferase
MTCPVSRRRLACALAATTSVLAFAAPLHAQTPEPPPANTSIATVIEEVPFVTSPDNVTLEMLRIAGVRRRDHVIDLGSGDGRIVITAARRFGATGLGVELDPTLVERSAKTAQEAGVADKVEFRVQDLFKTDLQRATVVTMYLLPQVNMQLRPALLKLKPGTRIVSHDWDMGDWKPDRTTVVPVPDKKVGREKSSKIHLWTVPARVEGTWCGQGEARAARLQIRQRHQMLGGTVSNGDRSKPLDGRLEGTRIRASMAMVLAQDGRSIRVPSGDVATGLAPGARFVRAGGGGCAG